MAPRASAITLDISCRRGLAQGTCPLTTAEVVSITVEAIRSGRAEGAGRESGEVGVTA